MGTPLKPLSVLLSPRFFTPLSPRSSSQLSPTVLQKNVVKSKSTNLRVQYVPRKLEFARLSPISKPLLEDIKIRVTDYTDENKANLKKSTKSDVLIDTPNKNDIVEHGLKSNNYLNILGSGRFGKVVRGIYNEKIVAVKVVKTCVSLRETNALHLSHLNITKIIDIVEQQRGKYSLVLMEYIPNSKQLQSLLDDLKFDLDNKIISFAKQISEGVKYCHHNGVLHLDMKPQNVLVCGNLCKICDFGNSIKLGNFEEFNHQGTIVYSAPELLQGGYPTEKCDIYSLGIIFWQLRSRVAPYFGVDNMETVIYKVVKCNWRPENITPYDEYSKLYQECWYTAAENRPTTSMILDKLAST